jgi:hypothetical protein
VWFHSTPDASVFLPNKLIPSASSSTLLVRPWYAASARTLDRNGLLFQFTERSLHSIF